MMRILGNAIIKARNVLFVAAGNVGFAYVSTQRLDTAFEDRFIKVRLNYLTTAEEAALIQARFPKVSRDAAATPIGQGRRGVTFGRTERNAIRFTFDSSGAGCGGLYPVRVQAG